MKRKTVLFHPKFLAALGLVLALFLSTMGVGKAESKAFEGFVIQADQIVGNSMVSKITTVGGKPVIRFEYESATIYGMTMTREFSTNAGTVTLKITSDKPVKVKNMYTDASALDLESPCISLGKTFPEIGLQNVTIVAHEMKAEYMDSGGLTLQTLSGPSGVKKPEVHSIITNLGQHAGSALQREIQKLMEGNAPLTCVTDDSESGDGLLTPPENVDDVVNEIEELISSPIDNPADLLEPILEVIENGLGIDGEKLKQELEKILTNSPLNVENTLMKISDLLNNPPEDAEQLVEKTQGVTNQAVLDVKNSVENTVKSATDSLTKPAKEQQTEQKQDSTSEEEASSPPPAPKIDEATKKAIGQLQALKEKIEEGLKQATDGNHDPPKQVVEDLKAIDQRIDSLLASSKDGLSSSEISQVTKLTDDVEDWFDLLGQVEKALTETTEEIGNTIGGLLN